MTHGSLSAGQQTAQVAHALAVFARERGEQFTHWYETSNYIIVLQEPSPVELEDLLMSARSRELSLVEFREPDRAHELTALAFIPHENVKRFLSRLPLAGKQFAAYDHDPSACDKTSDLPKKGASMSDVPSTMKGTSL